MSRKLNLLNWLDDQWQATKEYLRQDLDSIQAAFNDVRKDVDTLLDADDSGITELTDDVTAGPGSGAQAATVEGCPLTDLGNSGAALSIDFRGKRFGRFTFTLTDNCSLSFSNPIDGGCYVIMYQTGAGSFTLTWDAAVRWPDDTAPVASTDADKVDLVTLGYIGSIDRYIGSFNQNYTIT